MQNEIYTVDRLVKWVSPTHVLVRWSGYSRADDTVEPVSNMPQACVDELIERKGLFRQKKSCGKRKRDKFIVDHIVDWYDKDHAVVRWEGFTDMQDTIEPIKKMPKVCVDEFLQRVGAFGKKRRENVCVDRSISDSTYSPEEFEGMIEPCDTQSLFLSEAGVFAAANVLCDLAK